MSMRTCIFGLLSLLAAGPLAAAEPAVPAITPLLGVPFGQIVRLEFTAIAKPDTYYDQNIVVEDFALSITAIDGKPLAQPLIARPTPDLKDVYKIGTTYRVGAYETVFSEYEPKGWSDGAEPQLTYTIQHRVVIRKGSMGAKSPGSSQ